MHDNSSNVSAVASPDQFGMTGKEVRNNRIKSFWGAIKYFFLKIEPSLIRIFNTIVYWTIKIIKSVASSIVRMVLGKEI